MKKVVSFSLWGNNDHYTYGAIENAKSIGNEFYLDWESWFYVHPSVSQDIQEKIKDAGGKVIHSSYSEDFSILFERFKPMSYPEVSIFVSRDCDSRISDKEYQAVLEWENSDLQFHAMRDHFHHHLYVMGGLWGAKTQGPVNTSQAYKQMIDSCFGIHYNDDQKSLHFLYEKYSKNFLEHDDRQRHKGIKFPDHQSFEYGSFIGERITSDNQVGPIERWI